MIVSSRTPEGSPGHCPLCGEAVRIEPSSLTGDAPCPRCGQLLWFFAVPSEVRFYRRDGVSPAKRRKVELVLARLYADLGVRSEAFASGGAFWREVGGESLDIVELVMLLEEDLDIRVPDAEAEKIRSVADLIDFIIRKSPD
jgi:acyl carrier protein